MAALLICAAVADFRTHEVSDYITLPCVAAAAAHGLMDGHVYAVLTAATILLIVLFGQDNNRFGQADLLVYAALIARYGLFSLPILLLVPSLAALSLIAARAALGRFHRNQPIPFIPFIVLSLPAMHYLIITFWR